DIVQMFLLLLRKLERQTEKQIDREILRDFKLVEGKNQILYRIAQANHFYQYDELLYVRKHYFSPEALRLANIAVVNKILELRNPTL
ncbi:MAG: hypothetical protein ACR2N3_15975, partial [Pyrinomonadaceae bacterium]